MVSGSGKSSGERRSYTHEESLQRSREFPMKLEVHPSAFIAPGVVVVGDVTLGPRSSVWFGTVLRGDMDVIRIGEESNVQDNSVLHVDCGYPTTVGRRVVIGHRAVVHGATVGDGALVGMGAVVLNGAVIGAGSLVAAGALVGENKEFEERSLIVGIPGRAIGKVSDEMAESIIRGADHYVALSRTYLARGIGSPHPAATQPAYLGRGFAVVDELAIGHVLATLAASPGALAAALAGVEEAALDRPGPAGRPTLRWLVREWLWEVDELWGPRLERLLTEDSPELAPPSASEPPPVPDVETAVKRLAVAQARHLDALRDLPSTGWHSGGTVVDDGPVTVMEHLRRWTARDGFYLRRLQAGRRALGV
jgi:carbonic anhydrase/acetyltransferase-like protein (isoleucine patch superfamily)